MLKVLCWDFCSLWAPLPCYSLKGLQKRDFLDIYLTTVFGVCNFKHTSAMRVTFSWKCSKFYLHFKNGENKSEKVFPFRDNCIWIGCVKLSLLRREYLWPAVSVLKNIRKILPTTKRDFFELNWFHSDQYIWSRGRHSDFSTVWSHLPCCLLKGRLKSDILDIYLTTFLPTFQKFGKNWKKFFLLELIASELAALSCLY